MLLLRYHSHLVFINETSSNVSTSHMKRYIIDWQLYISAEVQV